MTSAGEHQCFQQNNSRLHCWSEGGHHIHSQHAQVCIQMVWGVQANGHPTHGDWHQVGEVIRCGCGQLEGGEASVIHVGGYPTRLLRTEPGTSESATLCLSHLFYSSQLLIFDFLQFYRQQVQWYSGQFTVVNKQHKCEEAFVLIPLVIF